MNKKWVIFLVFLGFLAQCKQTSRDGVSQPPADPETSRDGKTILSIAGISLTNLDLKNFIKTQYAELFEKKENDKLLSRLFDVFAEQQMILFKANQNGIQADENEVAEYLREIQSRRPDSAVDPGMVRNVLKVQKYLLAGAYKDVDVSDAEVARFYETHLADFQKTEEIELFQIMVNDRERLLKIRSELLAQPARFSEVARSESISPEAGSGGAMGFFERGILPKEMEEVVFSLKVNEISPIVESPYGFHLFKVTRKRRSRTQLLTAVKEEIRSKLLSAKLTAAYEQFLAGLKKEITVRVHYENLYFSYIKSDPGVNENENNDLPGRVPLPGN